jgi:hypothetical protein
MTTLPAGSVLLTVGAPRFRNQQVDSGKVYLIDAASGQSLATYTSDISNHRFGSFLSVVVSTDRPGIPRMLDLQVGCFRNSAAPGGGEAVLRGYTRLISQATGSIVGALSQPYDALFPLCAGAVGDPCLRKFCDEMRTAYDAYKGSLISAAATLGDAYIDARIVIPRARTR